MIAHRAGSPYSAYAATIAGVAVTIGDLIVVMYSLLSTSTGLTMADNAGGGSNAYTEVAHITHAAGSQGFDQNVGAWMFWAIAKATETLTLTGSGSSDEGYSVHVYSAAAAASPVRGSNTSTDTAAGTTHTGPTVASVLSGDVVVALAAQEDTASASSAWTNSFTERTEQTSHVHHSADLVVGADGTYGTGFTSSASEPYVHIVAAFKAAAAGGIAVPVLMSQYRRRRH